MSLLESKAVPQHENIEVAKGQCQPQCQVYLTCVYRYIHTCMDTVVVRAYLFFFVLDLEQHHEHKSVQSFRRCLGLSHQVHPQTLRTFCFKDLLESLARSSKLAAAFVRWQRQQCFNICVHQVHSSCRFLWYPHCTLLWVSVWWNGDGVQKKEVKF